MRKLIYVLGIVVAVGACKSGAYNQQTSSVDYVLLSGNIANNTAEIYVTSREDRGKSFSQAISIGEDGSFSDTLRVATGDYRLGTRGNALYVYLYLTPGDNIVVDVDANDSDNDITITGTGEGVEITNYILAKGKTVGPAVRGNVGLDEAAYKAKFEGIKNQLTAILDASTEISDDYKNKEKRNLQYEYLTRLDRYAYDQGIPDDKVSEGFLSEFDDVDYDNEEEYYSLDSYKKVVSIHYGKKAEELAEKNSIPEDIALLKIYANNVSAEVMRNDLLYGFVSSRMAYSATLEDYYSTFMAASTNEEHKSKITDKYKKLQVLAKGQPSPKFVDLVNYEGGTTSLDDLKGKYVYVDVWATWCGPCIKQTPYFEKVAAEYEGNDNIVFVSLSMDSDGDGDRKWRAMLAKKEHGSILELRAGKVWNDPFIKGYMLSGIPRFILIDPNGDIVTANAPWPQKYDDLIALFNESNI